MDLGGGNPEKNTPDIIFLSAEAPFLENSFLASCPSCGMNDLSYLILVTTEILLPSISTPLEYASRNLQSCYFILEHPIFFPLSVSEVEL